MAKLKAGGTGEQCRPECSSFQTPREAWVTDSSCSSLWGSCWSGRMTAFSFHLPCLLGRRHSQAELRTSWWELRSQARMGSSDSWASSSCSRPLLLLLQVVTLLRGVFHTGDLWKMLFTYPLPSTSASQGLPACPHVSLQKAQTQGCK